MVHGLLSFEFLSHGTHSTIFNDIVLSDLTSHTCIISNILLDHGKKVSVAGIGAIKYIICIYNCNIDKMFYISVSGKSYTWNRVVLVVRFLN